MADERDYSIECVTRKRTTVLRGVVRLEHEATERLFAAISADLEATGTEPYTIDVSDVAFMNSSAIRALATLVLAAKRVGRRLTIVGRQSVPWQSRTLGSLKSLYDGVEIRLAGDSKPALRREQDYWALETPDGRTLRLKDSKGLAYLERLLGQPGRELHVLEIVGVDAAGDAGPVLDERAKAQYRERVAELRDEVADAERLNDSSRAARLREEMAVIGDQLAEAVGLGGRDRRPGSDVEKARINVQRCIKEALDRIAKVDAALGRYFSATVKTGTYCSFRPF